MFSRFEDWRVGLGVLMWVKRGGGVRKVATEESVGERRLALVVLMCRSVFVNSSFFWCFSLQNLSIIIYEQGLISWMDPKTCSTLRVPNVINIASLMTLFGPTERVGRTNHSFSAVVIVFDCVSVSQNQSDHFGQSQRTTTPPT